MAPADLASPPHGAPGVAFDGVHRRYRAVSGSGGSPVHPSPRCAAGPVLRNGFGPTPRGNTLTTGIGRTVYPGLPIRPYPGQRWADRSPGRRDGASLCPPLNLA
jgi:hypothetical protein